MEVYSREMENLKWNTFPFHAIYLFCWHVNCDQLLSRCPADHQVLEGSFRREMSTTHIMRGSVVNKKQKKKEKKKEKKKKVNLTFDKP